MSNHRSNKSTARDWQRSLFIGSLAEQLDKMANAKGEIEAEMQEYLEEGMSTVEAEELLMAEGHDLDLVKSCSSRFVPITSASLLLPVIRWGYRIGDNNGRIISHIETDSVIEASNIDEATKQLEEIISDAGTDASFTEIIEVFQLDKESQI